MAMFKWSGFYINPADVTAIITGVDNRQSHAHYMTVHLRSGKEYQSNYAREEARNLDAARLANEVSKLQAEPITRYEVEDIVSRAKEAVRRDIKALRDELKKEE